MQLTGAEVDSRRVREGDLFVALRGARCDGHVFVTDALSVAAAALVRYDAEFDSIPSDRALIRVQDPLAAYWELARYERARRNWRVVAVTGSVGKTTTKDMLAALLEPSLRGRRHRGEPKLHPRSAGGDSLAAGGHRGLRR